MRRAGGTFRSTPEVEITYAHTARRARTINADYISGKIHLFGIRGIVLINDAAANVKRARILCYDHAYLLRIIYVLM